MSGAAMWLSLQRAAELLDLSAAALRRKLERRAVRSKDGTVEAVIDGVHARKFGSLWRVRFSDAWVAGTDLDRGAGARIEASRGPAK